MRACGSGTRATDVLTGIPSDRHPPSQRWHAVQRLHFLHRGVSTWSFQVGTPSPQPVNTKLANNAEVLSLYLHRPARQTATRPVLADDYTPVPHHATTV